MAQSFLAEKRGIVKQLFTFYSSPTVPTIRIAMRGNFPVLELGKRARLRENSIIDGIDRKGWDILSSPVPMIQGKNIEMGYILHPSGCTVDLKPNVKVQAADEEGNPIIIQVPKTDENGKPVLKEDGTPEMVSGYRYVELNFEGVIGVHSDLDDFNESTEREQSRGWVLPLFVGIVAGVVFFAPMVAYLMSMAAGKH